MQVFENQKIEATFCFVDIAGYTALTETHGDETAADLVTLFSTLLEQATVQRGRVLEIIGDAALIVCPDSCGAIELVADLFHAAHHIPHFPILRAGLHRGSALSRGGRFFGTTLNLAARVSAEAQSGQVLATRQVAEAAQSQGIHIRNLGLFRPKNLTDPVELFELNISDVTLACPVDPVCRMRVQRHHVAKTVTFEQQDFSFCSEECAERFVANPALYIS